jgi:dienelactone hydrolase
MGAVDPSGEWIYWFADTDGDEFGVWMRQPFGGGPDEPGFPGLDAAYPCGIAVGSSGLAVVGCGREEGWTAHLCVPGHEPVLLYEHDESGYVDALSRDESLVSIAHSEHGDRRHMALRVVRLDGSTVGELWDGPGKAVRSGGFAPTAADPRLLVSHERHGRDELLIWDPVSGAEDELTMPLPGEIDADWFPDGYALLVSHNHQARDELYRFELSSRTLERIETPRGIIGGASARPDGTVEYLWSSAAEAPVIRSTSGAVVLTPPGPPAPSSVPATDVWVDGPGGRVHVLISVPEGGRRPYPTVVDIHGGPDMQHDDSFSPGVAAWVDHGFAVMRPNYRGSTGYGSAWRDALEGRVGFTELEDIKAARDWAVALGLADPDRLVLTGGSWGGYLTLLALGTQPDDWSVGVALVPIADLVAAYEDETEELKAFDRALFGGSPDSVPEKYEQSSPITYVDRAKAPVLVVAGQNDPLCPIRQIDNYLKRLAELGLPHEVLRYDAGHGSLVVEQRIAQKATELDFVRRHLGTSLAGAD